MRIIDFLFGKMTLAFDCQQDHTAVFEILRRSGANYQNIHLKDQTLILICPYKDGKCLCRIFSQRQISYRIEKEQGLYLLLRRTKCRPGLYLGAALFLFVILMSTRFVFDIRISGNETLTDAEVLMQLQNEGFSYGSFLPNVDMEALCNRIVLHSDEISWISVNMLGTIAHVEIKERQNKEYPQPESGLSCLVAARDGVILGFDCATGTIAVNVGQTVKKGELLVSGVIENTNGTYFSDATGAVRARTQRVFSVTIPKKETVTVGYERTIIEKSIIFLGKTVKLFSKYGNLPSSCDTIKESVLQLSLTKEHLLPIFEKTVYYETPIQLITTYSATQAMRMATEQINQQIDKISDLRVLSCTTEWSETKDGYTLTKKMTCIENIAKKVPITTN